MNNSHSELEQKLAEERAAKLRLENRILELEKQSSMMDCDNKQALQKLDELRRHKDHLTEEVSVSVLHRKPVKFGFSCQMSPTGATSAANVKSVISEIG